MGCLTVLPNDEELLLIDLSLKVRKKFKPKKRLPNLVFVLYFFIFCFFLKILKIKVTNIQIVIHPYLVKLSKNMLDVFHKDIAICESHEN